MHHWFLSRKFTPFSKVCDKFAFQAKFTELRLRSEYVDPPCQRLLPKAILQ
jgi:hypothetical protein